MTDTEAIRLTIAFLQSPYASSFMREFLKDELAAMNEFDRASYVAHQKHNAVIALSSLKVRLDMQGKT